MKQLLVPIDFLDNSAEKLNFAVELAKKIGAIITISKNIYVNVISEINHSNKEQVDLIIQRKKEEHIDAIEKTIVLHKEKFYEGSNKKLQFKIEVQKGLIEDTLNALTKNRNYDLILLSNNGFNRLTELLWKRKKSIISDNVKSSILIIPNQYIYQDISEISYITNLVNNDKNVIEKLEEIAKCFFATVSTIHVTTDKEKQNIDPDLLVFLVTNERLINSFFKIDPNKKFSLHISKPLLLFSL